VADQALSSLTNFLLAVVLARELTPEGFGATSITFAVYLLGLNVSRSLTTEPLTVRHSHLERSAWARPTAAALGAATLTGVLSMVILLVAGAIIAGPVGGSLAALAIMMPGLLLQDAWRFAFFAAGKPRDAFLNDFLWLVFMVLTLWVALGSGSPEPWPYVLAWGLAGALAGLAGIAQARLLPAPQLTAEWFRGHRDLASRYAAEAIVLTGAAQLRLVIVGAVGGLAMAGAIRAGQVILGAIHPLTYGVQLTAVPDAVGTARRDLARLTPLVVRLGVLLGLASLLWGILVWFVPVALGETLFGATWDDARTTIPGQTVVVVASGLASGAVVGLRALAAARHSLRSRTFTSALGLAGAVLGALSGDAGLCSMIIGLAVASGAVQWWFSYVGARREAAVGRRPDDEITTGEETRLEVEGLAAEGLAAET